jgi:hypothetical protein
MAHSAEPHAARGVPKGPVKSRAPQPNQLGSLSALQAAVNDASSRAAALWLSFLTFMAYLTMTVGAVTHEALLKQTAIKLPVLNVELPLVGFFWIAPLFFLLFHFYLFLQLVILVRKVASFDANLRIAVATEWEREEYRKRLDSFLVVQFMCGAKEERTGMTSSIASIYSCHYACHFADLVASAVSTDIPALSRYLGNVGSSDSNLD